MKIIYTNLQQIRKKGLNLMLKLQQGAGIVKSLILIFLKTQTSHSVNMCSRGSKTVYNFIKTLCLKKMHLLGPIYVVKHN